MPAKKNLMAPFFQSKLYFPVRLLKETCRQKNFAWRNFWWKMPADKTENWKNVVLFAVYASFNGAIFLQQTLYFAVRHVKIFAIKISPGLNPFIIS